MELAQTDLNERGIRPHDFSSRTERRFSAAAAVVAAVCYSSFVMERWTQSTVSGSRSFISSLEASGEPWAWLYRTTDVVAGAAMLIVAWALRRRLGRRPGTTIAAVLLMLAGICSIIDGATSMRCSGSIDAPCAVAERHPLGMLSQLYALHVDSGVGGLIGLCGAAILFGAALTRSPTTMRVGRWWIALGALVGVSGLADVVVLMSGGDIGVVERIRTLLSSAWLLAVYWEIRRDRLPVVLPTYRLHSVGHHPGQRA